MTRPTQPARATNTKNSIQLVKPEHLQQTNKNTEIISGPNVRRKNKVKRAAVEKKQLQLNHQCDGFNNWTEIIQAKTKSEETKERVLAEVEAEEKEETKKNLVNNNNNNNNNKNNKNRI